jgi:hypothetical protein
MGRSLASSQVPVSVRRRSNLSAGDWVAKLAGRPAHVASMAGWVAAAAAVVVGQQAAATLLLPSPWCSRRTYTPRMGTTRALPALPYGKLAVLRSHGD